MIWAKLVGINEGLKLNIKFGAGLREYFLCFLIDFLTKYVNVSEFFVISYIFVTWCWLANVKAVKFKAADC